MADLRDYASLRGLTEPDDLPPLDAYDEFSESPRLSVVPASGPAAGAEAALPEPEAPRPPLLRHVRELLTNPPRRPLADTRHHRGGHAGDVVRTAGGRKVFYRSQHGGIHRLRVGLARPPSHPRASRLHFGRRGRGCISPPAGVATQQPRCTTTGRAALCVLSHGPLG